MSNRCLDTNMLEGEPVGDIRDPDSLDPISLGFMCGIEIHQQLSSGKLHSRQPGVLYDGTEDQIQNPPRVIAKRRLRAARGESGTVDVAARFEEMRNRSFAYLQTPNSGLIELDEAPPLQIDSDALDTTLQISAMFSAAPVNKIQTMRKTVVDGSNTSGFQRTSLIATGGRFEVDNAEIGISVICLEEDSARRLGEETTDRGTEVTYSLDRLGIPLVEIATEPDIVSPEHAKSVSSFLGRRLRDTRSVRRGLGSIRQDLNVSIACGDRVEIKGCQDLGWIPRIIRSEMARQIHFYRLSNTLRANHNFPPLGSDRRMDDPSSEASIREGVHRIIPGRVQDISEIMDGVESDIITSAMSSGSSIMVLALPGLSGYLGTKERDGNGAQLPRLGRELSGAAKRAGVHGIIHSDELPAYGLKIDDIDSIRTQLSLENSDAFAICIAPSWQAELALDAVAERARMAFLRIPQEVRNVVIKKGQPDDGTTMPMRPLPGGARMYPETDVPLTGIDSSRWTRAVDSIPMTSEERLSRLSETGLSETQAEAILGAELDDLLIEAAIEGYSDMPLISPKSIATALLDQTLSEASSAANIKKSAFPLKALFQAILARDKGAITRDGVIPISALMASDNNLLDAPYNERMSWIKLQGDALGFKPADNTVIESVVDEVISEHADIIEARGKASIGPLMGIVMSRLGGAADGKVVSQILRKKI
ncbi:MAG: Glu-tRNA(Gln) amidotransferase subunit GatE [Candidatus Thalassarchaeaceae archaeon]